MLKLDYWTRNWQSVSLNPEKGLFSLNWLPSKQATLTGWAYKFRGKWYALYFDGHRIAFQTEKLALSINNHCSSRNELSGVERTFTIFKDDNEIFNITYPAREINDDPTYDVLDLETEDFFYWVNKLINDQKYLESLFKRKL